MYKAKSEKKEDFKVSILDTQNRSYVLMQVFTVLPILPQFEMSTRSLELGENKTIAISSKICEYDDMYDFEIESPCLTGRIKQCRLVI